MSDPTNIDVDPGIHTNAVSIIDDGADDFPVLKAFQQYIDAEQNKARKRMLSLCIFFGFLLTIVILVFLFLLNGVSMRNQALNDRLLEYVMKDRDKQAAVVVQPPSDNATMFLTAKIEEMQKKLADAQRRAEAVEAAQKEAELKAATEAAVMAAKEKAKIKEAIEVARLKAQLESEREKAATERAKAEAEKEKRHQEEIEAYRRKHYPELYGEKPVNKVENPLPSDDEDEERKIDQEIDTLLKEFNDKEAVTYFEEDDKDGKPPEKSSTEGSSKKPASYTIPVEVKGNRAKWVIPKD